VNDIHSQSHSHSYNDDVFYRRAPSDANLNPDLLHQALLPPSRFASGSPDGNLLNSSSVVESKSLFQPGLNRTMASSRRRVPSSHLDHGSRTTARTSSAHYAQQTTYSNEGNGNFSTVNSGKRKKPWWTLASQRSVGKDGKDGKKKNYSARMQIPVAVLLWYLLGVISISTTKVLLTDYSEVGMTPLLLTMQQFVIGIIFLRAWIYIRNGKPPYPIPMRKVISPPQRNNTEIVGYDKLVFSAIFFTLGFLLTNLSFSGSDASFVETVKASEPISSAGLAVLWGIETMGFKEVYSLIGICIGVVISTLGNAHGAPVDNALVAEGAATLAQSIYSSGIVMGSNLSFSFRGLYQKLFRASPNGGSYLIDDLNLQFRIHQVGIIVMVIPLCVFELPSLFRIVSGHIPIGTLMDGKQLRSFLILSIVNGFAFTHYK